jgi:drug/metabolite transporter (DMT)-like permease
VSRSLVLALYALLVLIWSSTWVGIKIGLEDCPPLLGAGVRFALAGLVLLVLAALQRRPLRTDWLLATVLALAPFAFAYGLVYWGEQYVPSGLAAVLFGVLPLYTALLAGVLLPNEPLRAPLLVGVLIGIGGLALAFLESVELGSADRAALGAAALALAPLGAAVGSIWQKRRGAELDAVVLNGWAMLAGGLLLLPVSALGEDWGDFVWSAESVGSIAYLALFGSAIAFVTLTVLLRHLTAQAISFLAMLLPFGALVFGATLYDEPITARALAGAALVATGLLIAQRSRRQREDRADPLTGAAATAET